MAESGRQTRSKSKKSEKSKWRVPLIACVLLVLLRLSIGWQFLYEGLWKLDTLDTPAPWSAAGYLQISHGPLRNFFRGTLGTDPDELHWLDQKRVAARWKNWAERFTSHYELTKQQQGRLSDLLFGEKDFRAALDKLPEGVSIPEDLQDTVKFYPESNRLIVPGDKHMTRAEHDKLVGLVEMPEDKTSEQAQAVQAYLDAVDKVFARASRLSIMERMRVLLGPYDPERVRIVFANFEGTIGNHAPKNVGKYYRELLANYRAELATAQKTGLDYQRVHLEESSEDLQKLRTALVGPIKALEAELHTGARDILTLAPLEIRQAQRARGPLPPLWTKQHLIDIATIAALSILGILLIGGLATRLAAVLAAGMLLSFYLVWPPWPGVPEIPGDTSHTFIVNKNLIEMLALLALAALPTGRWFGLDGLICATWRSLTSRGKSTDGRQSPKKGDKRGPVTAGA